jgi:putative transposase
LRREMPRLGTHKLYYLLQEPLVSHGIKMGRDKLHKLLQEQGLVLKKHKKYVKTTDSRFWVWKYPNLLENLVITESEQAWVSDITYVRVGRDFNYLSLITDAYSKRIVGYCLSKCLSAIGCMEALDMALSTRTKLIACIHHSDRGSQYRSDPYVTKLTNAGIAVSMTQDGDPYENAVAERVNGILKSEFGLDRTFRDHRHATRIVSLSIDKYNSKRPHASCDYLTPIQAHEQQGVLKKRWKSARRTQEQFP